MPYVAMTGIKLPDDASTIWRYMDLWKFESLLNTFGLYFVRSDRFVDRWDSVLPPKWLVKMQDEMCKRATGGVYTKASWYEEREIPSNPIHCWNCDVDENSRMWKEYTESPNALAIKSTVGRLKQCFASTTKKIQIGLVNYGDHDELDEQKFAVGFWNNNSRLGRPNPWYVPRYFKKKEFDFEKEIRASLHVSQAIEHGFNLNIGRDGVQTLIQSIRLHPNAGTKFSIRINSLIGKFGLNNITVENSTLMRKGK